MTTMTKDDYEYFRSLLVNDRNVTQNDIEKLKLLYENEINSVRKLDAINKIEDLIEILEKRGCISEQDFTVLENIAQEIPCKPYLLQRTKSLQDELVIFPKNNIVIGHNLDIATTKVHELIITELGKKWMEFARALYIRESRVDEIKIKYQNEPSTCIKEVLKFHLENAHPREWKRQLLVALEKARRRDLRNKADKLFHTYTDN